MNTEPHIVIVGGGFSGAAVAIALMRLAPAGVRVTLLEPRPLPGAGVAYSTAEPSHRINVPAARMQLAGDEEGAFDRWYREQPAFGTDPDALREDGAAYPQRGQFGLYVARRFAEAAAASSGRLVHLQSSALAFDEGVVVSESGQRLKADLLVLAISHPPPSVPARLRPWLDHPGLIANPWQTERLDAIGTDARVAIMGTGLTMADTVAALSRRGHRGPITAFSRRGLLSRPNLSGEYPEWDGEYLRGNLRQRLRQIRADVAAAAEHGLPWQRVLDAVRNQGQQIWQGLSIADRLRFLRHLRSYWDVHRYRIAPQVADELARRQDDGSLRVLAARLGALEARGAALRLTLAVRQGQDLPGSLPLEVDNLILTTGPAHGNLIASQPFLRDLARQELIRADALNLGIDVDSQSRARGHRRDAAPPVFVSGPAARARFGELMGLPQVADHAAFVAAEALSQLQIIHPERCPAS